MSQLKVKTVEEQGGCTDDLLTGKAIVTTPKKTCWEKIIDFLKKLFGIN